jgi:hypothetical protein
VTRQRKGAAYRCKLKLHESVRCKRKLPSEVQLRNVPADDPRCFSYLTAGRKSIIATARISKIATLRMTLNT